MSHHVPMAPVITKRGRNSWLLRKRIVKRGNSVYMAVLPQQREHGAYMRVMRK